MHSIQIDHIKFTLPAKREELEKPQLVHYLAAVFSDLPLEEKADFFLHRIMDKQQSRAVGRLNDVQFLQVRELLLWVGDDWSPAPFPEKIQIGLSVYHGPAHFMESSSFAEFVFADAYFQLAVTDAEYIPHLMACLYRRRDKRKKRGDLREAFDGDKLAESAELFKKTGFFTKLSVLMFFTAVKRTLVERYEVLFSGGNSDAEGDAVGSWQNTMLSVAERGTFGNLEMVKSANFHEVLLYLEKNTKEAMAAKAKNKNHAHR